MHIAFNTLVKPPHCLGHTIENMSNSVANTLFIGVCVWWGELWLVADEMLTDL